MRNAMAPVPKVAQQMVAATLRTVFAQPATMRARTRPSNASAGSSRSANTPVSLQNSLLCPIGRREVSIRTCGANQLCRCQFTRARARRLTRS
jgi:hypothetical protein